MQANLPDGSELRVERDVIEYTPFMEPNPDWQFIDAQGHIHTWESDTWVSMSTGEDWYYRSWCECKICGERVWPGTSPTLTRKYAFGATHYTLDGQTISREQAESLLRE